MARRSALWTWAFVIGLSTVQADLSQSNAGPASESRSISHVRSDHGHASTAAAHPPSRTNIPLDIGSSPRETGSADRENAQAFDPFVRLDQESQAFPALSHDRPLLRLAAPCSAKDVFQAFQCPGEIHFIDVRQSPVEVASSTSPSQTAQDADAKADETTISTADANLETPSFLSFEEWRSRAIAEQARQAEEAAQRRKASQAKAEGGGEEQTMANSGHGETSNHTANGTNLATGPKAVLEYIPSATDVEGAVAIGVPGTDDSHRKNETLDRAVSKDGPSQGTQQAPLTPAALAQASVQMLKRLDDRVNYAKDDCAARILSSNPEAKHTSSILSEKKDRYMLNPCGAPSKFVIIELCGDLKVDTVVLANFEFFSSMVKNFKVGVGVATDGPWIDLGTFRAKNTRGLQIFQPSSEVLNIFARYIRIDFLTHYGSEFYCPISLVRVYGLTEMEAWRKEQEAAERERIEAELPITEQTTIEDVPSPTQLQLNVTQTDDDAKTVSPMPESSESLQEVQPSTQVAPSEVSVEVTVPPSITAANATIAPTPGPPSSSNAVMDMSTVPKRVKELLSMLTLPIDTPISEVPRSTDASIRPARTTQSTSEQNPSLTSPGNGQTMTAKTDAPEASEVKPKPSSVSSESLKESTSTNSTGDLSLSSSTQGSSSTVSTKIPQMGGPPPVPPPAQNASASASVRVPAVNIPGGTQESIYKTIMNRLTALEKNATLSLQYIEDQSKMFRDVLIRIERRQEERMEHIVRGLNESATIQLLEIQSRYEALLSEVMQGQSHRTGLTDRVNRLSDEVMFGKRLGLTQLVILLSTLVLLLFTRSVDSEPIYTFKAFIRERSYHPEDMLEGLSKNRGFKASKDKGTFNGDNDRLQGSRRPSDNHSWSELSS